MFFIVVFIMCACRNTDSPTTAMLSYHDIFISSFWSVCSCLLECTVIYKFLGMIFNILQTYFHASQSSFVVVAIVVGLLQLAMMMMIWLFLSSGHLAWQQFIFNPTCGLAIPQLEFLAYIFALGQAEQFCILLCMASCFTILNCTTVHSRQLIWLNLM